MCFGQMYKKVITNIKGVPMFLVRNSQPHNYIHSVHTIRFLCSCAVFTNVNYLL